MRQERDDDYDTNEFNAENTEEFLIEEEFGEGNADFHDYDGHEYGQDTPCVGRQTFVP